MANPSPPPLTALPLEIIHHVVQSFVDDLGRANNVTSLLTTSKQLHAIVLPKLYSSIHLRSLSQVDSFLFPSSAARRICADLTTGTFRVDIAGVPGGGDGGGLADEQRLATDRLLRVSRALLLCPNVAHVSFEFFSLRHSEFTTPTEFRLAERHTFEAAVRQLARLKSFYWGPPKAEATNIQGLSIAVVDSVVGPLVAGLMSDKAHFERLELRNAMLPTLGGGLNVLRAALSFLQSIKTDAPATSGPGEVQTEAQAQRIKLTMSSVTNVDPCLVAGLVIGIAQPALGKLRPQESNAIEVHVTDAFVESVWGPRLDTDQVKKAIYELFEWDEAVGPGNPLDPDSLERKAWIQRALSRLRIEQRSVT
ncbi:uncharacterized protein PFL1_04103 [Pseudozyma flocculosa PF-1]|uniref:Uncharacterized protein n=1 Tax=Pseudozyma flocculosa PF-1 TaxID=1277687 RepID=A0A061HCD1_9BASI|nr:uncharacterized protein PFL1_04103 [Pseudozyma flocculosa PF-1]EPQ28276.1 hypothetical protein PFL1_04103 [Pseudozyma flocculosa PF-1]